MDLLTMGNLFIFLYGILCGLTITFRCWIIHSQNKYRLVFFIPLLIYMLGCVLCLIYVAFKLRDYELYNYNPKYVLYCVVLVYYSHISQSNQSNAKPYFTNPQSISHFLCIFLFLYFRLIVNTPEKNRFSFQLAKYVIIFVIFWMPVVLCHIMEALNSILINIRRVSNYN